MEIYTFFIVASTNNNSDDYKKEESCNVLRCHHGELCSILNISETTLLSLAGRFYARSIIDNPTKLEVRRVKGFEGADILMEHVELKVEQNHECLGEVLEIMENEECLCDVVKRMNEGITYATPYIPISSFSLLDINSILGKQISDGSHQKRKFICKLIHDITCILFILFLCNYIQNWRCSLIVLLYYNHYYFCEHFKK